MSNEDTKMIDSRDSVIVSALMTLLAKPKPHNGDKEIAAPTSAAPTSDL